MSEKNGQRANIDQMARRIVDSTRENGGQADFKKVRERIRQHQVRSENKEPHR